MATAFDTTALTAEDCPLLVKYGGEETGRLLERFSAALDEVRAVEKEKSLAPLLLTGRLADVLAPLEKARSKMVRRRYNVGCIGITQAGKSTTINNVLGEEICKPGAGDATSSQPSRVMFAAQRTLDVEFLTPPRFASRRQKLCEAIGLATPEDDEKLLARLADPEFLRSAEATDRPRFKEDVAYLREFLTARNKHKENLREPPKCLDGRPYEERYAYTTHTKGGPGSEVLLVREARFRIDNKLLPGDLELCDLPGLDSKRSIDDIVTWEYLPELDGSFLFVNVGMNLLSEGMLKVFERIKNEFKGKLAGRGWLIFNKMDSLTGDHFRVRGQDNIFTTIARVLEYTGIPESQVVFSSKKLWDLVEKPSGKIAPAAAAQSMSQPVDQPIPESCPPGLRSAWEELLRDGGVAFLRRLMFEQVAVSLAAQIRQDVHGHLSEFQTGFAARIAAEKKRLSMDNGELLAAATSLNVVLQLKSDLAAKPNDFPILLQESERLRQVLTDTFDRGGPPELLNNLSPAEFAQQFRTHARVLSQSLDIELTGEMIDRVFQIIGERLGSLLPKYKEVWQRFALEDQADKGWRMGLPQFSNEGLAKWIAHPAGETIDGTIYAGLMREKITIAVRKTVHLLRSRLRSRLGQIAGELTLLTGDQA